MWGVVKSVNKNLFGSFYIGYRGGSELVSSCVVFENLIWRERERERERREMAFLCLVALVIPSLE
jgi:hypothetical protein